MSSLTIIYDLQETKFVLINWLKVVQWDCLTEIIYHATSQLSFISYFFQQMIVKSNNEGCPSKSWTFVITQDCVQVTL